MSLPHAILTALLEKPSSGLELTRRFDRSIGYFWSATHQQIYRELGKLEAEGHIRALPAEQPTRGQKKSYEVLPAGRAELAALDGRGPGPQAAPRRAAAAAARRGRRRHRGPRGRPAPPSRPAPAAVGRVRGDREAGLPARQRQRPQDRLQHLVLRAGIDLETFWTQWLTEALEELPVLEDGPG